MAAVVVVKALGVALKAVDTVFSVVETCEVVLDKDVSVREKVLLVATNALAVGTGLAQKRIVKSRASVGIKVGATVFHSAARAVQTRVRTCCGGKECSFSARDIMELAGIVVIGGSDTFNVFIKTQPKFFSNVQKIEQINKLVKEGARVLVDGQIASRNKKKIGLLGQALKKYFHQTGESFARGSVLSHDFDRREESVQAQMRAFIATPVEEMDDIPEFLRGDSVLSIWRDASTGEPIRHVVKVRAARGSSSPCFYERKTIEGLIARGEKPDSWPRGVAFELAQLKPDSHAQEVINGHLVQLQKEAFDGFALEEEEGP